MSDPILDDDNNVTVDPLVSLKAKADLMGITYHPSIGLDKLREKVNAKLEGTDEEEEEAGDVEPLPEEVVSTIPAPSVLAAVEAPAPVVEQVPVTTEASTMPPANETKDQRRNRLRREATALVRVVVVCMNPNKTEWPGELFSVGNSVVPTVKKFVPFNNDAGYHIPRIIYNMMQERKCQVFYNVTDKNGNRIRKSKLIKEFSIEVLPPLTEAELRALAQQQAMRRGEDV